MQEEVKHTIVLGGCGGDSHSVGLTILKTALADSGYNVRYLGTQNKLEEFFKYADKASAVFISSMDGHAEIYLQDFIDLRLAYPDAYKDKLWFLGGNLSIDDGFGVEKKFMDLGFHRVYTSFVDIEVVLSTLAGELAGKSIPPQTVQENFKPDYSAYSFDEYELEEYKNNVEVFHAERKEVLQHWKTGAECKDLESNAIVLKKVPNLCQLQLKYSDEGKTLIQPRSGVADFNQQMNYFKLFQHHGAGVLSYQVDSLTRNNNYLEAEIQIKESHKFGVSKLNGFPVVNYGAKKLREMSYTIPTPIQVRHSTRDPRLLAEISYASGATAYEGGPICYNIPYYKAYSLSESLKMWRYVDRLTGLYYEEYGIVLDREYFGCLTATLIPPSLALSVTIIESILAAEQGVKSVSLGYAEQGNRSQDIAAIRSSVKLAQKWLKDFGYKDVKVFTAFYQYMAAFPQVFEKAENLIYESAKTAGMSGATRVLTKTAVEALRVPSMADNLEGIALVSRGIEDGKLEFPDETKIAQECEIIEAEVNQIISSVVEAGKGNLSLGVIQAFRTGQLDVPFSPSIFNRGEVVGLRDSEGAVRYAKTGKLKFDSDVKEMNRHKLSSRFAQEGLKPRSQLYRLIEKDVLRVARSQYDTWPLG